MMTRSVGRVNRTFMAALALPSRRARATLEMGEKFRDEAPNVFAFFVFPAPG